RWAYYHDGFTSIYHTRNSIKSEDGRYEYLYQLVGKNKVRLDRQIEQFEELQRVLVRV
ncbi:hypothetical protein H7169_02950, partial [Candidatus Gracilibacteria bacterium]|nr:hypothetical protein [Candidatus Gracilibacteria bacterium]